MDTSSRTTPSPNTCCSNHHHVFETASLCLCSLANAFVVMSMFPYAGFMVLDLMPGRTTSETVGAYAGLLAGSFMFGRFFLAYQWGMLADSYGRLFALQLCLILSAVFSILFGMAQTMKGALLWRCCLGMCNGLISLTKTLANEVARDDEIWERRIMGLVVGMRSWGMLIAPAVSGFLSEPLQQYPQLQASEWMKQHSFLHQLLSKYPFILPNLIVAVICCAASLSLALFVGETLAPDHRQDIRKIPVHLHSWLRQVGCNAKKTWRRRFSTSEECVSLQTLPSSCTSPSESGMVANGKMPSPWSLSLTRRHMICHWMFALATTYIDEAFPLFCMSTVGGLGLVESSIGSILSMAGLLFVLLQYISFAVLTHVVGLYYSLEIGCLIGTFLCIFIPLSIYLEDHVRLSTILLSVLLGFVKLMHSLFYTSMAVAINKTVESRQRARMNSLILVGNSVSKAFGPIFAGAFVSFSFSGTALVPPRYGSWLIWLLVPPLLGVMTYLRVKSLHLSVLARASVN